MFAVDNPVTSNNNDIKDALFAKLYNVTIYITGENGNWIDRKQFYAGDIVGAISQGEEFGTVIKVCESNYDDEDWRFRL